MAVMGEDFLPRFLASSQELLSGRGRESAQREGGFGRDALFVGRLEEVVVVPYQ